MIRLFMSWLLSLAIIGTASAQYGTERTGYEGDYFSLEGAIELFKDSRTLNQFERRINSRDNWVNNLDLDFDGRTDYVRVEHRRKGNYHAIILQVPLGRREFQDIAVFEIEKTGRREAILQVIGDRDMYGEEIVVEPVEALSYSGDNYGRNSSYGYEDYVNVYHWPLVQHIFGRDYRVYASPYRWNYYPTWWSPWRPYAWNVYRPRTRVYYNTCRVVNIIRVPRVHKFYHPHRSYSQNIVNRTRKVRLERTEKQIHRGNATPRKFGSRTQAYDRKDNVVRKPSPRVSRQDTRRENTGAVRSTPKRKTEVRRPATTTTKESSNRRVYTSPRRSGSAVQNSNTDTRKVTPRRSDTSTKKQTYSAPRKSGSSSVRSNTPRTSSSGTVRSTPRKSTSGTVRSTAPRKSVKRSSPSTSRPSASKKTTTVKRSTATRSSSAVKRSTAPAKKSTTSSSRKSPRRNQ